MCAPRCSDQGFHEHPTGHSATIRPPVPAASDQADLSGPWWRLIRRWLEAGEDRRGAELPWMISGRRFWPSSLRHVPCANIISLKALASPVLPMTCLFPRRSRRSARDPAADRGRELQHGRCLPFGNKTNLEQDNPWSFLREKGYGFPVRPGRGNVGGLAALAAMSALLVRSLRRWRARSAP